MTTDISGTAAGTFARLACLALTFITLAGCSGGGGPGDDGGGPGGGSGDGGGGAGDGNGPRTDAQGLPITPPDATPPAPNPDADPPPGQSDSGGEKRPGSTASNGRLTQALIARRLFDPALSRFDIGVFYELGAEPYTGSLGLSANDTWDVTTASYRDLFSAHAGRGVSAPRRLAQMQAMPDQGIQDWTIAQLIELGNAWAPPLIEGDTGQVSVLFVNGTYEGNRNVLGIHPTHHPFSFVFKDIVRSVGGDATTQRYVEQATVVHEVGHSIGLVDNGLPMVNAHMDTEHPHHTTDEDGVMHWTIESGNGILASLTDVIVGARLSLFGSASLLDAHNYMPSD